MTDKTSLDALKAAAESDLTAREQAAESAEKAAEETAESVEKAAKKTAESAEKAAEETAESVEKAAEETAESVEKAAEETAESVEKAAEKTAESAEEPNDKPEKKHSIVADLLDILESVLVATFVVILAYAYVVRPITVDGRSMYDTLDDGDKLIMLNLFYEPKYGDIVIINNRYAYNYDENGNIVQSPGIRNDERLIKRIIATGGQEVAIDFVHGKVSVDGEVLDEPYIYENTYIREQFPESGKLVVPEGYYFVMGDNRNNSTDSRSVHVGFIPRKAILGKAMVRLDHGFEDIYYNFEG